MKEKWIVYVCVLVFECEREMDCLCECVLIFECEREMDCLCMCVGLRM